MKTYTITSEDKEYILYVGESAAENWRMLNKAKQWYYFFHLSSFASGYGMLVCDIHEKVPTHVLKRCGGCILSNTKYRNLRNVKIDCTKYSNVKRGAVLGEVFYKNSKNVTVLYI